MTKEERKPERVCIKEQRRLDDLRRQRIVLGETPEKENLDTPPKEKE